MRKRTEMQLTLLFEEVDAVEDDGELGGLIACCCCLERGDVAVVVQSRVRLVSEGEVVTFKGIILVGGC